MSNHLKRFTNHNNYNAHISTGAAVLPNVCVCDNENEIHYNELKLITFTIENVQYQAEEGMAWSDWINSKYNTGNWQAGNYTIYAGNAVISNVQPSDIIISKTYETHYGGGGSND